MSDDIKLQLLQEHPLFRHLSHEKLVSVSGLLKLKTYGRGDVFGYGEGATLTQVGATDSWTVTADAAHGGASEVIQISAVFGLTAQDYLFH